MADEQAKEPSKYAKPGPYVTKLSPEEEQQFKQWVTANKIPWQDIPNANYDMRGYWKAQRSGDPIAIRAKNKHFPDKWKTPYHTLFSNESMYATPEAPHWQGDKLVPTASQSSTGERYVKLPDGRYLHLTGHENGEQLDAIKAKVRSMVQAKTSTTTPLVSTTPSPSLWEAANRPLGEEKLGAKGGIPGEARRLITKYVPESIRGPVQTASDVLTAIPEAGRQMITPLGVATAGAGGATQLLRSAPGVPQLLKTITGALETGTGIGFGAQGIGSAITPKGKDESTVDYIQRVLQGIGQGMFGAAAVGHARPGANVAKQTGRQLFGVGEKNVDLARQATEGRNAEKQRQYSEKVQEKLDDHQKAVTERMTEFQSREAEAKREHNKEEAERRSQYQREETEKKAAFEAKRAKTESENAAKLAEARAKHEADIEATERAYGEKVGREASEQLRGTRLKAAKDKLSQAKDVKAAETVKMIDQAEKQERASLDSRWNAFRDSVKGVLVDMTPIREEIERVRRDVIKGSKENIGVFNQILGPKTLVEDPISGAKSEVSKPLEVDQLRGFWTELGDAMARPVDGDVYRALRQVRDKIGENIDAAVKDHLGADGWSQYQQLKSDWSAYERSWRDRSSGTPLRKILQVIRYPVAQKEGVNVTNRVADMLVKGYTPGEAATILASKSKFGGSAKSITDLAALDKQLNKLESSYSRLPVVRRPRYGVPSASQPPETPRYTPFKLTEPPTMEPSDPFEVRPFKERRPPRPTPFEPPKEPKSEQFNPEQFRREKILEEAKKLSKLTGWDLFSIYEFFLGHPLAITYPIGKRAIGRVSTTPTVLDWLSKE